MTNEEMKKYDFIEGIDFDGLMPHAIDKTAGIGESKVSTHFYAQHMGMESLTIVDVASFYESINPEPVVVRPDETENNEEQQAVEDEVIDAVTAESGGTSVKLSADTINNLVIPENATRSVTITGPVQDGATIENDSPSKYITVNNTSEEPVDVAVLTSGGTVYISGNYNDVYVEGKGIATSSGNYANVNGTVSVQDTDQPVTLSLNFVGDDCGVVYLGDDDLTINDGNTADMGSPTIYAPNASVSMGGKYTDVTATVSDNTLILKSGFHANKLTVLKGNVYVNGLDINDFADELDLHPGCEIIYPEFHVSQSDYSKLMASSLANGKVILDTDIELTKGRQLGVLASGKELIDLNGHTWKCGDSRTGNTTGSLYLRGSANMFIMDSAGGGKFINNHEDYLVWAAAKDVEVNVLSGEFEGYIHVLYAYAGTINVYGGSFKMLGENTDRDINGNYKFLLNCYDANYTAGTAKINVYGGKFYEFNPAVAYSEPGGPVSFVAEGYHVEESIEDGVRVYEVLHD